MGEIEIHGENGERSNQNITVLLLILLLPFLAISLNHDGFLSLLSFVRRDFNLTLTQVSYYSTFYFIGGAVLAVLAGGVVDRLGPKKSMVIGLGFMGVAVFTYGLVPSYALLLVPALVSGAGFSVINSGINKSVITLIPSSRRAVSLGIIHSGIGIGGFAAASLLPLWASQMGWRSTMQGVAGLAIAVAIVIFLTFDDEHDNRKDSSLQFRDVLHVASELLRDSGIMKVNIISTVMSGTGFAVVAHYVVFLTTDLDITPQTAGLCLGIMHIGGLFGRPTWGRISDTVFRGDRMSALIAVGMLMGVIYVAIGLVIYSSSMSTMILYGISLLLGLSVLSWFSMAYVAAGEMAGGERAGISTGLILLVTRLGMLFGPLLFGMLADYTGDYRVSWLSFGSMVISITAFFQIWRAGDAGPH